MEHLHFWAIWEWEGPPRYCFANKDKYSQNLKFIQKIRRNCFWRSMIHNIVSNSSHRTPPFLNYLRMSRITETAVSMMSMMSALRSYTIDISRCGFVLLSWSPCLPASQPIDLQARPPIGHLADPPTSNSYNKGLSKDYETGGQNGQSNNFWNWCIYFSRMTKNNLSWWFLQSTSNEL